MSAVATSLMTLLVGVEVVVGVEVTHPVERQTLCSAVHVFLSPLEAAGSVIGGSTPQDSCSPVDTVGTAGSANNKNQSIVITTTTAVYSLRQRCPTCKYYYEYMFGFSSEKTRHFQPMISELCHYVIPFIPVHIEEHSIPQFLIYHELAKWS